MVLRRLRPRALALLAIPASLLACSGTQSATDTPTVTGGTSSGGSTASGGTSGGGSERDLGPEKEAFLGASRCDEAGLLLCDGFEAEGIDTALWAQTMTGASTLALDGTVAARGAKSLHVHAENGRAFLKNVSAFPVANNAYFGRMFVRVARFSTVAWAHWTLAEAAGTGDGSLIRVGGQYRTDLAKNAWGIGSDGGPTGDWTNHDGDPAGSPVEPPLNEWVCIEWQHDGALDETRFFVDAVEHPSLATTATSHGGTQTANYVMPEFTSLWVGFWQYQADPEPFDVWLDEVAIDTARIGCKL